MTRSRTHVPLNMGPFFDYDRQCWVKGGVILDCFHPEAGVSVLDLAGRRTTWPGCSCYGRAHAGERWEPANPGGSR